MGEPVRIVDLARRMVELSGKRPDEDVEIRVVGIRPGEKLHEELFNVDEQVTPTRYGKVRRATRPTIDEDGLRAGLDRLSRIIADGRRDDLAVALWDTLGGRASADERETDVTSTIEERAT